MSEILRILSRILTLRFSAEDLTWQSWAEELEPLALIYFQPKTALAASPSH